MQTPSFVRILCTLFVVGLTQAASLDSSVIKPRWFKFTILYRRKIKSKHTGLDCFKYFLLWVQLSQRCSSWWYVSFTSRWIWIEEMAYIRIQLLQSKPYHLVLSLQGVWWIRYLRLCHLSMLPSIPVEWAMIRSQESMRTHRTIAKLFTPRILAGLRLHFDTQKLILHMGGEGRIEPTTATRYWSRICSIGM